MGCQTQKKRQKKEEDKTPNVTWRNPVAVGAGQHFFIQVLPKSRMSFTAKQKKMAKSSALRPQWLEPLEETQQASMTYSAALRRLVTSHGKEPTKDW